jgi:hypothetical protein
VGTDEFLTLTIALALVVGAIALVAGCCASGSRFISEPSR